MAKQISAFTRVCQEDQVGLWGCAHQAHLGFPAHLFLQVSLLKGGCTELMILRSVVNFDSEKNAWQVEIPFFLSLQFSSRSPDTRKFGQKGSQHGCPKGWEGSTLFIGCDVNYWESSWKSDLNGCIFWNWSGFDWIIGFYEERWCVTGLSRRQAGSGSTCMRSTRGLLKPKRQDLYHPSILPSLISQPFLFSLIFFSFQVCLLLPTGLIKMLEIDFYGFVCTSLL